MTACKIKKKLLQIDYNNEKKTQKNCTFAYSYKKGL
jgi:hypothetical protein